MTRTASDTRRPDGGIDTPGRRRTPALLAGAGLVAFGLKRRSLAGAGLALAGAYVLYRTVADDGSGRPPPGQDERSDATAGSLTAERSLTIAADPEEIIDSWRDATLLERVAEPVAEVRELEEGSDRWEWTIRTPIGRPLRWETEITDEEPGERLRWESLGGELVAHDGELRLRPAPADRGTEVTLRLHFTPPGGEPIVAVAERLNLIPDALAGSILHRFKSVVETGEVPTLEANPSARGSGDLV